MAELKLDIFIWLIAPFVPLIILALLKPTTDRRKGR